MSRKRFFTGELADAFVRVEAKFQEARRVIQFQRTIRRHIDRAKAQHLHDTANTLREVRDDCDSADAEWMRQKASEAREFAREGDPRNRARKVAFMFERAADALTRLNRFPPKTASTRYNAGGLSYLVGDATVDVHLFTDQRCLKCHHTPCPCCEDFCDQSGVNSDYDPDPQMCCDTGPCVYSAPPRFFLADGSDWDFNTHTRELDDE